MGGAGEGGGPCPLCAALLPGACTTHSVQLMSRKWPPVCEWAAWEAKKGKVPGQGPTASQSPAQDHPPPIPIPSLPSPHLPLHCLSTELSSREASLSHLEDTSGKLPQGAVRKWGTLWTAPGTPGVSRLTLVHLLTRRGD